ncbi:hypothetical protein E4M02_04280 [Brevundimonas sp. S30B]|nr:hypothetical protein E4M02_04280 [Brevundimonas sp. S30B]
MIQFHDLADTSDEQTFDWLEHIAANLRDGDRDEMIAANPLLTIGPPDALLLLTMSVMQSEQAWVITDQDEPVCIFGCAPEGIVWMMGTPGMWKPRPAAVVAKATAAYVERLHERWPCLWNWVDARNVQSARWLRWSGFEIADVDPRHGREQRLFIKFTHTNREGPTHL